MKPPIWQRTPARVSVVVPACNAAQHLGAAPDSLRAETLSDWEAIVDDGSADHTADIVRQYSQRVEQGTPQELLEKPHGALRRMLQRGGAEPPVCHEPGARVADV